MDFSQEMNAASKVETGSKYINKACVATVVITKVEFSPADHKGTPYIQFPVETDDEEKRISTVRLYRVKDGDSEQAKEIKLKMLKQFIENTGMDMKTIKTPQDLGKIVGKKIKCLFKEEEYIGIDKNMNNKPTIKTAVKYSFSGHVDNVLQGNQSYFYKELKPADKSKYEAQLEVWNRENGSLGQPIQSEDTGMDAPVQSVKSDDDLPF